MPRSNSSRYFAIVQPCPSSPTRLATGTRTLSKKHWFTSWSPAIVMIGLTYTNIDQDWYLVFLGGMLLVAVLFNNIIRKRVTGER